MTSTAAALLIGINKYPSVPLLGCVPDVLSMRQFLTERRNVSPKKIRFLIDKDAKKEAILEGMEWLAAQGTDLAYVIYSGHGTRVHDVDGDEARQNSGTPFDQAICPVDYERRGFILDDDLADHFALFPPTTKIIAHLDSCYSAKSDRGLMAHVIDRYWHGRVPRALPANKVSGAAIAATYANRKYNSRGAVRRRSVILLSGCRDFETSADAFLGNVNRGAMTYFVEQSIQQLGDRATYRQVIELARKLLAQNSFSQIPQLSGDSHWLNNPIYT